MALPAAGLHARVAYRGLIRRQRRALPCSGGAPTYAGDFPDPCIVGVGDVHYAYGTQVGGMNVPVLRSSNLSRWVPVADAVPTLYRWALGGRTWSPTVLPRHNGYVLYHAVRDARSNRQCIAAATATSPEGPFVDAIGGPFVLQGERGGSIDPSTFLDADGRVYLLWKSDDNALGRASSLWGQVVSDDGLTLVDRPTELLRHDRSWEEPLVEAPSMVCREGTYYLFYSANWWESGRYGIGYAAAAAGPLGPFVKITRRGPWMASGHDAAGPGGQEFFQDKDGGLCMAYHAWMPGAESYGAGGVRSLRMVRVGFRDGRPVVET